jgi:signal transduction histidine kinase
MRFFRGLFSPLVAFIAIQIVWIALVVFWVTWFLGSHRELRNLAEKYAPAGRPLGTDWVILFEGLLLLAVLLAGIYVIFLFWQRQASLYRAQKNFIAQVTHELKSPLASLQLHLETIRLRRPGAERMDVFLDTMLSDTERLHNLINNLLTANRLEQRGTRLQLQPTDLSELVTGYFRPRQYSLTRAGRMELHIAEGLWAQVDSEALETVFRNLLENAVLYSDAPPDIVVQLKKQGRHALLSVTDQGRGIERREQKKVFGMFYRVRRKGENIRGSGLGLFIVRTVTRMHGGIAWLESAGTGKGTTVYLRLPLLPDNYREEAS